MNYSLWFFNITLKHYMKLRSITMLNAISRALFETELVAVFSLLQNILWHIRKGLLQLQKKLLDIRWHGVEIFLHSDNASQSPRWSGVEAFAGRLWRHWPSCAPLNLFQRKMWPCHVHFSQKWQQRKKCVHAFEVTYSLHQRRVHHFDTIPWKYFSKSIVNEENLKLVST